MLQKFEFIKTFIKIGSRLLYEFFGAKTLEPKTFETDQDFSPPPFQPFGAL